MNQKAGATVYGRPKILSLALSFLHSLPTDKAVDVIEQKRRKADNDRQIANVRDACYYPQNDEDDIVCRIGQGKIRNSAGGQIDGKKARCDRKRAWEWLKNYNGLKGYCVLTRIIFCFD